MKADWKPVTEPPKVPETQNHIAVLGMWKDSLIPEVFLYWSDGMWTYTNEYILFEDELPDAWTHLPSMEDVS